MAKSSTEIFETQLVNCILSCPVIYIEHYHFSYIDEVIRHIMSNYTSLHLSSENILEYDIGQLTPIFFDSKKKIDVGRKGLTYLLQSLVFQSDVKLSDKRIYLLKLSKELLDEKNISLIDTFASKYEEGAYDETTTIIIESPESSSSLPLSLRNIATILEIAPPTVSEIRELISSCIGETSFSNPRQKKYAEEMVRTLQGLQMYEVKQTLKTVLALRNNRIDRSAIRIALEEKKRIVRKSGIIEVIDSNISFDEVGGLQRLREDLEIKSMIYHHLGDAEKYNVSIPKGILIIGMPGCGKSMIAQAAANLFEVSLLRLDVSRLMGKYVGESEANLRLALSAAEAAHPCVLWIDEIEKAFAGSNNSSGDNDMLVMRMMGHFLTWMQERKSPVYIIATANDIMRPEFMRKGRFDDVYFVDFPDEAERAEILKKKIDKRFNSSDLFDFSSIGDCKDVVKDMKGYYGGFSGSEIECVLNMVVEKKFSQYLLDKQTSVASEELVPSKIKIEKEDFAEVIERMKDSVMANQKSEKKKEEDLLQDKTSIERIREMNETYRFTNAAK